VRTSLDLSSFWKAYFAVFLSFVTNRLLLQTDILMLTPLGQAATAAFAIPGRLMIIDTIIAFALGPVVSVAVSRAITLEEKYATIKSALGLTLILSLLLVCIGLLIYPWAVDYFVVDTSTKGLATTGVLWMTVSIPIRILAFIASMSLFACQQGRQVSYIYSLGAINCRIMWR
jgi:Na+-driven multidrug efflux pump